MCLRYGFGIYSVKQKFDEQFAVFTIDTVGAGYILPAALPQIVPFIDATVQTYYFAPLRGASLSCFAKKVTKEGDLGAALRLCCGNTSTFRYYPRQPNIALRLDPLPRCARLLHDTNRFLNISINIYLTLIQIHRRSRYLSYSLLVVSH